MSHAAEHPVYCARREDLGCPASYPQSKFGKIRASAAGWFHSLAENLAYCPDHVPDWVPGWRVTDLPRRPPGGRAPQGLWLPALGELTADEPLSYKMGALGPKGHARLQAWDTADGGHFVLLAWTEGLVLAEVARPLRCQLEERFGTPFALAELRPASVDLILAPVPGQDQGWLRVFPAPDGPHRAALEAWWAVYGDTVCIL